MLVALETKEDVNLLASSQTLVKFFLPALGHLTQLAPTCVPPPASPEVR